MRRRSEVLQSLYRSTADQSIKKDIKVKQMYIEPALLENVIKHSNDFTDLYKKTQSLKRLGCTETDEVLIKQEGENFSLETSKSYKDERTFLQIYNILKVPKKKSDKDNAERIRSFFYWCRDTKSFTNAQMHKKLRELKVYNRNHLHFEVLKRVINAFDYHLVRQEETRVLICFKI